MFAYLHNLYMRIAATTANPLATFDDIYMAIGWLFVISFVRFAISGVYQKHLRHIPCLLDYFIPAHLTDIQRRKICENMWYTLWHTTSFCMGLTLFLSPNEDSWKTDLWAGRSNHAFLLDWQNFKMSAEMKQFYMIELGFWSSCLLYIFIETKRSDFFVMLAHHIFTIALICFSYYCNHFRMGLMVLLLHDLGDIFLYSAKSMKVFSGNKRAEAVTDALFIAFAVSFFVCRIVLYPYWICWPVTRTNPYWRDYLDPLFGDKYEVNFVLEKWGRETTHGIGYYTFPVLLYSLECLHLFWFTLILKIATKSFGKNSKGGVLEAGDIRESSDDEEEEAEERYRRIQEGEELVNEHNLTKQSSVRKRVMKYEKVVDSKAKENPGPVRKVS